MEIQICIIVINILRKPIACFVFIIVANVEQSTKISNAR